MTWIDNVQEISACAGEDNSINSCSIMGSKEILKVRKWEMILGFQMSLHYFAEVFGRTFTGDVWKIVHRFFLNAHSTLLKVEEFRKLKQSQTNNEALFKLVFWFRLDHSLIACKCISLEGWEIRACLAIIVLTRKVMEMRVLEVEEVAGLSVLVSKYQFLDIKSLNFW